MPRGPALAAAVVGALLIAVAGPAAAAPTDQPAVLTVADPVPGSYIVRLQPAAARALSSTADVRDLAGTYGGKVTSHWRAVLGGFAVRMSAADATRLAGDPRVATVRQNAYVHAAAIQTDPPSWGLNRIDQRSRPQSSSYVYPSTAPAVTAYVIDTGIRTTHADFGGRASWGADFVNGANTDCNGHGTHVAGTLGGSSYGVAKAVRLVAVRVLDCSGGGTTEQVINGVNWVRTNARFPAVANMSLGGGIQPELDQAVRDAIGAGVTFVLASGNFGTDACNVSPARVGEAITVNSADSVDTRAPTSDYGTCTDLFAPGVGITSAWHTSDTASQTISGTSMASPHVAGAAALWLSQHPNDTPAQVAAGLTGSATPDAVVNPGTGSPNRLLFTGALTEPVPAAAPDVTGDLRTDLALVGGNGWNTIPVAASTGTGAFTVSNGSSPSFAALTQATGARTVSGDFNADGRADLAVTGGPGWTTVATALSTGNGAFSVVTAAVGDFAGWSQAADVRVVPGDFNGDRRTDIALVPGPNTPWWFTQPVAFSNGDGTYRITNTPLNDFAGWAQVPGGQVAAGDFNNDGRTDLALTPGPDTPWWYTQPVAFSNGDGTFAVTNASLPDFAGWAQVPRVRLLTGDFNADGRTDLTLVPGPNTPWWYTQPVAFSNGNGTFTTTNTPLSDFAGWAQVPGGRVVPGDFNGDGRTDLTLTAGPNTPWWYTMPTALANGDGTFAVTNPAHADFAGWAQVPGVRLVAGDLNTDGRTDLALTPGPDTPWWYTIPVAFATGTGDYTVTNTDPPSFPGWAQVPGARVVGVTGR